MAKSKVYFTRDISPEKVIEMYKLLGIELPGRVAVKVHSGEKGNQNYLHPEFMRPMVEYVNGRIVETNTAYGGARDYTKDHRVLLADHGWSHYFDVDIMDEEGDFEIEVPNGKYLKKNRIGNHMKNYDSMLILAHFKGHPVGGFGGALKQLSIGCASAEGKCRIHSAGKVDDRSCWSDGVMASKEPFMESMADAATSVVKYFKGNMAFVNIMCNLSVDCDCCAVAEDPCMKDIGILSSLDPVALDRACMDLVIASEDPGRDHFLERVNSRVGQRTISAAAELGAGTTEYELIEVK